MHRGTCGYPQAEGGPCSVCEPHSIPRCSQHPRAHAPAPLHGPSPVSNPSLFSPNKEVSVSALHRPDNHQKPNLLHIRRDGVTRAAPLPPLWASPWAAGGDVGQGCGGTARGEMAHGALPTLGTSGLVLLEGLHTLPEQGWFWGRHLPPPPPLPTPPSVQRWAHVMLHATAALKPPSISSLHWAGIISCMETDSRERQDLGETPCTPPATSSDKDEGTRGRQPVSGMGLRFLPHFPKQR